MTTILKLPYPPSANRYWATRVMNAKSAGGRPMATTYITADAKAFKDVVHKTARAAGIVAPITGRVKLEVWLYPHRPLDWEKRVRKLGEDWDDSVQCIDLDNANKVLLDSLKGLAFDDDKWVRVLIAQRCEPDDGGARVVVRISAIQSTKPQGALL